MIITKRGKCERDDCENRVTERREFLINVDMFDPEPKTYLKGPLLDEIKKFKREKVVCPEHAEKRASAIMAS